ncbi:NHLP leader peptide family RiPP precursor [uncultured Tenacibaculum sp.]|uniref:NHLP leader peptide family RiPP precursor n=1 Tax=uncultured Tenacibaculum sp. TaxID=174713 RepID=UPI0026235B45|nr:NHLP leader peptide family RiPP precursor [uncultured Tenacibaculum sp.]
MKKTDWLPYGQLPVPVIMKAWSDDAFKQALLSDPKKALEDLGYDLGNYEIQVSENTSNKMNLTLPDIPESLQSLSSDGIKRYLADTTTCSATGTCD